MRKVRLVAALLLVATTSLACGSLRIPFLDRFTKKMSGTTLTEDELRNELAGYAARFGAIVSDAAEDIAAETPDRTIRRRTLVWRMKMIPPVQEVAFSDSPQEGYLRLLGISVAQSLYLREGEGRALFGPQQQIAVDAAVQLQNDALEIGSRLMTPEQQAKVLADVEAIAEKNPIVGRDFSLQRIVQARATIRTSESLMGVLTLPLAPFKALEGVDSGAEAIRDFTVTAKQFSLIIAQLPDQLRAEIELLLYDVEDRETVVETVAAMQEMADSAERASHSIENLPAELQKSLAESQGALQEANKALLTAKEALVPLEQVSSNLKLASDAWGTILARDPNEPPGRPFDVREWQSTAAQIGTSAGELRALAVELNTLTAGTQLDAAVDHATWRAAQLVALFFVLLVVYRLVAWQLERTRRES